MIIFVFGPDTFRSRQYLSKIIAKFKVDRDPAGYNVAIFDLENTPKMTVVSELFAMPFLAEKRMVVIKNLLAGKAGYTRQEIFEIIKNNRLPESTVAVFWERVAEFKDKDSKSLFELLRKEKYQEYFPLLETKEAGSWFTVQIETRGGKIDRGVVESAIKLVGTDSFVLQHLADQLANYCPGKVIMANDLNQFVTEKVDDNIFNLVDAIIVGKVQSALAMMRQQYSLGEDEQYIFGMLIRQFKIMLQIADALATAPTSTPDDLAQVLGLHPFVVKKTIPFIKKFSFLELKTLFSKLADIDKLVKTGQGDMGTLLDIMVVKIGSAP